MCFTRPVLLCVLCCFEICVITCYVLLRVLFCFVFCAITCSVLLRVLCCYVFCVVTISVLLCVLCCYEFCVVMSSVLLCVLCCYEFCVVMCSVFYEFCVVTRSVLLCVLCYRMLLQHLINLCIELQFTNHTAEFLVANIHSAAQLTDLECSLQCTQQSTSLHPRTLFLYPLKCQRLLHLLPGLTFKAFTRFSHCVCVFRTDLRTSSEFYLIDH